MREGRAARQIVLWGVGHAHAHVAREWGRRPIPGARLICVSDHRIATYSGMLPGVLAGEYPRQRMSLDLERFCLAVGVTLHIAKATGLDRVGRTLIVEDRPPIPFDVLSIGIGSTSVTAGVEVDGEAVVPLKPMPTFLDRLEARLLNFQGTSLARPPRLVVVGGGAGGVEIAFCVRTCAKRVLGPPGVEVSLVHSGEHLAAGDSPSTNELARRRLVASGVDVHLQSRVSSICQRGLTLANGESLDADIVIWAAGAAAPEILGKLGLPVDERGFPLTRPTLQSVADDSIFVVGDSGTISGFQTPKAGVFAVRHGPVLWRNITRRLGGKTLQPFRPQRTFLRLLNTGDGRAIGEYRGLTFEGRWCRRLKDFLDRRFLDRYQGV